MKSISLIPLFFLSAWVILFTGCSDEKKDFTSGSFYPDLEEDPDSSTVEENTCWDSLIEVRRAQDFNALFTRYGDGWTGGDATYSIPLPDGRTLWLFGDTFLGIVRADRSRPPTGLIRNSFVVMDGDQLTTLFQGSAGNASAFVSPAETEWWYWPGHGIARENTLQVVLFGFKNVGEGMWGFEYACLDVANFSLPDFHLLSVERKTLDPTVNYGACVLEDGDYLYLYGAEKVGLLKYLHVARTGRADLAGDWEYFDGTGWTLDAGKSARIFLNVSEQFSVLKHNGRYYLITQHHILGSEIFLYSSDSPTGPFADKRIAYCTPESGGDIFTYNAFAHPQFLENGELLISYNVNSFNFSDLLKNADNYRPFFVRVKGWDD